MAKRYCYQKYFINFVVYQPVSFSEEMQDISNKRLKYYNHEKRNAQASLSAKRTGASD